MSLKIRSMMKKGDSRGAMLQRVKPLEFKDGRTKQSFKDSTDINKILKKAQGGMSLAHLMKYPEAVYGEFNGDFDLLTAKRQIERADEIFAR